MSNATKQKNTTADLLNNVFDAGSYLVWLAPEAGPILATILHFVREDVMSLVQGDEQNEDFGYSRTIEDLFQYFQREKSSDYAHRIRTFGEFRNQMVTLLSEKSGTTTDSAKALIFAPESGYLSLINGALDLRSGSLPDMCNAIIEDQNFGEELAWINPVDWLRAVEGHQHMLALFTMHLEFRWISMMFHLVERDLAQKAGEIEAAKKAELLAYGAFNNFVLAYNAALERIEAIDDTMASKRVAMVSAVSKINSIQTAHGPVLDGLEDWIYWKSRPDPWFAMVKVDESILFWDTHKLNYVVAYDPEKDLDDGWKKGAIYPGYGFKDLALNKEIQIVNDIYYIPTASVGRGQSRQRPIERPDVAEERRKDYIASYVQKSYAEEISAQTQLVLKSWADLLDKVKKEIFPASPHSPKKPRKEN